MALSIDEKKQIIEKFAKEKGLSLVNGVYVDEVSETGGARNAGIRSGDVIVSVDNMPVTTNAELLEIIGQHNPGDYVAIVVDRDGKKQEYNVELRNQEGTTAIAKEETDYYLDDLGAVLEPIPDKDASNLGLSYGMKVTELKDGMLRRGGVQEGFIILQINGVKVETKSDVELALDNIKGGVIRIEGVYPNGMRMNYGFIL